MFCRVPLSYPGSGVVIDCIDFRAFQPFLLSKEERAVLLYSIMFLLPCYVQCSVIFYGVVVCL